MTPTVFQGATINRSKIRVVSLGAMVIKAFVQSKEWRVISHFKRSFYCCDDKKNIICVGQKEIGEGPFTVLCSPDSDWPENVLSHCRYLLMRENKLLLEGDGVVFDLQGASIWKKNLCTINKSQKYLHEDLHFIATKAVVDAPSESIGYLVPHFFSVRNSGGRREEACSLSHKIHQLFFNVINEIRSEPFSFKAKRHMSHQLAEPLGRLIGLGHGLTPSGDDFLAGVVMGLYKTAKTEDAKYLAHYFERAAAERTTAVSLAFYRALNEGFVAEPFYQLLEILGSGQTKLLAGTLKRIGGVGATSGWDTLAGILFGISLVSQVSNKFYTNRAEALC